MSAHIEFIRPSDFFATGGYWSGTEGRHQKHFIALIPVTRYVETRQTH